MSWLSGYKSKPSTSKEPTESELREIKRQKLEAERESRAKNRAALQKQLAVAQQARQEANEALQGLLDIDPEIFEGSEAVEDVSEDILDNSLDEENAVIMVDFDRENAEDSATAMDNLRSVQCPFNKADIVFWFCQLEDQLTLVGVKKQWTKKIALVRFLPPEIQNEVKSLLKLQQTAAGEDIYFRIKQRLLKLYGPKPEDAYIHAKNRVLTGVPSQLGKLLVEDLCTGDAKLEGCHCANIVWGMFREKIPIVIRNHIADMPFNHTTFEAVFDKADQVFNSNKSAEPLPNPQVAASTVQASAEVAAVQRKGQNRGQNGKNKNQNASGQSGNKGQNQNKNGGQKNQNQEQNQGQSKSPLNEESLCRIHAKWKDNATFCAAPWGCKMKNVWKAPQ